MKGNPASRWIGMVCVISLIGLLAPALCRADGIDTLVNFQTSNQSEWGFGSGDQTVSLFNVDKSIVAGDTFGSVSSKSICFGSLGCVSTGDWGYQVTASAFGDFRSAMSVNFNGGTVDAQVPVEVKLGFEPVANANRSFSLISKGVFQPGAQFSTSSLTSLGATFSATAGVNGFLSVEGCLGTCTTATADLPLGAQISQSLSLTPGKSISDGIFSGSVGNPFPSTFATTSTAQQGTTLQLSSSGSSQFLNLVAEPTNAVTGLKGNYDVGIASVDYDLLDATAKVGLSSNQSFTLSATPEVSYLLQYKGAHPGESKTDFAPLGASYFGNIPDGDTSVDVTPFYAMTASLSNDSFLTPSLLFSLNAAQFGFSIEDVGSVNVGPLFYAGQTFQFPDVSMFDQTLNLGGWNQVQGKTFQIDMPATPGGSGTNPPPVSPVPEPPTWILFGTGLLFCAWRLRLRGTISLRPRA